MEGGIMTPESIRMSNLILDAEMQCSKRGHSMGWRRYSNYNAGADCRYCNGWANINTSFMGSPFTGTALTTNCTKKER